MRFRTLLPLGALLLLAFPLLAASHEEHLPGTLLRYSKPADIRYRLSGLPLGNGRVGAMVAGDPKHDVILLNHHRLRPVLYRETSGKAESRLLKDLRQLYLTGQHEDAQACFAEIVKQSGSQRRLNSYHGIGDLVVAVTHTGPVEAYQRMLDMRRGVARVTYRAGDVRFTRTYFVDFEDDCFVLHITADHPGSVSATVGLRRAAVQGCRLTSASDETALRLQGAYTDSTRFDVCAHLQHSGGTASVQKAEYEGPRDLQSGDELVSSRISGADALTIFCSIDVAHEGKPADKRSPCVPRVPEDVESRLARHAKRHTAAMGRCVLRLGEGELEGAPPRMTGELVGRARRGTVPAALIEAVFQAGRYQLLASSRPGTLPANLQGIWSDGVRPAWQGRYQLDMNLQMCYWPANVTGLDFCNAPFFDLLDSLVPAARAHAADRYGCRGIILPVGIDETNVRYPSNSEFQGAAGWLARHYWEHYRFTGDRVFLAERSYPFMKECGAFFEDILFEGADGRLAILPSSSPENEPKGREGRLTMNAVIDVAVAREVFSSLIRASEILDVDANRRCRWRAILDKLPDWPIDEDGALAEWADPSAKGNQTHRHLSHLYGLFPGESFTPEESPELVAAAVKAIRKREAAFAEDACGWTYAWLVALFARAGDGNEAYRNVGIYCRGFLTPGNLMSTISDLSGTGLGRTRHGPLIQIEAGLGITAGIAEMLVQSHKGQIQTLPALPRCWPAGSVRGLCARGGFEIDIDWQEGVERCVVVRSRLGETCWLRPRNKARDWEIRCAGEAISVVPCADGRIELNTDRGGAYRLAPRPSL